MYVWAAAAAAAAFLLIVVVVVVAVVLVLIVVVVVVVVVLTAVVETFFPSYSLPIHEPSKQHNHSEQQSVIKFYKLSVNYSTKYLVTACKTRVVRQVFHRTKTDFIWN